MNVAVRLAREWWQPHVAEDLDVELGASATVADLVASIQVHGAAVLKNGEPAEADDLVLDGDQFHVVLIPGGPEIFTLAALKKFFIMIALSYVVSRLTAPNLDARTPEDEASPTYAWNGIRTVYTPLGMPYPMVLGSHWVGGYVLQSYVENEDGPDRKSWLFLLLALSLGPVQSVAGELADEDELDGSYLKYLRINGNPARNYGGLTAWVRMGSLQQETIAPFSAVRTIYPVALPLDQVTEESGDPVEVLWERAVQVELTTECERARATLRFPRGLYELVSGELEPDTVEVQVRYARMNSLGDRISQWATAYDGADDIFNVSAAHQGAFNKDLALDFFDPETVSAPQAGYANQLNGLNQHASTGLRLAGNPSWTAGAQFNGTILWRGRVTQEVTHNPICSWADWNQLYGPGFMNLTGFLLDLRGDTAIGHSFFSVYWGIGGGTTKGTHWDYFEGKAFPQLDDLVETGVPYQLVFTFEHNVFSTSTPHRLRLWINDALFGEHKTAVGITCPTGGRFYAATFIGMTANTLHAADADFDELEIRASVYDADDVAFRHAEGSWTRPTLPDPDLVAYWSFAADQFSEVTDFSGNNNDLGWTNINYPPAIPGWTYIPASGTRIRSRYMVQVQRIDPIRDGLSVADEVELDSITAIADDALGYPGIALLGLKILASEQLSGNRPEILSLVVGRADLPRWDGRSADSPTFTRGHSRNPADQLALVATDELEGAGNYYSAKLVDWPAFKGWREFCARSVYDQRGSFHALSLSKVTAASLGLSDDDYPNGLYQFAFAERVRNYDPEIRIQISAVEDPDYPSGTFDTVHAYINTHGLFIMAAPWPEGLADPTTNPYLSATAALTWRLRPQIQSDLVLGERNVRFWGVVQMLCAIGRATPVRIGDKLSVVWQDARSPVAMFNATNIDRRTFRALARRRQDQPNVLTAEFQDVDLRNERSVITRTHPELTQQSSTALRVASTVDMRGATERHQVRRELDYLLRRARAENLELEFTALLDAIFLQVGDVALITYPLPDWAAGGTVLVSSVSGSTLTIDREVVMLPSTTYYAAVQQRSTSEVAYVEVATAAGTYAAGSTLTLLQALPFTPVYGDLWAVGTETTATQPFQLFGRSWSPGTHFVKTRWVAYDASVYPADDHGLGDDEVDIWSGAPDHESLDLGIERATAAFSEDTAEVQVREEAGRDRKSGAQTYHLRVTWTPPASEPASTRIWAVSSSGVRYNLGSVSGRNEARVDAGKLLRGERYRIAVQHVTAQGGRKELGRCPAAYMRARCLYARPPAPLSITAAGAGDSIWYEVELPPDFAGCAVEVRRGGAFVGRTVGMIPTGGTLLPQSLDWSTHTGPAERVEARLVTASGVRSSAAVGYVQHTPSGSTILAHLEYSPTWTAPGGKIYSASLGFFEIGAAGELRWNPNSIGLTSYFAGWEFDLGASKRVHVSAIIDGTQISSATLASLPALGLDDPALSSWTGEGTLDKADPAFEALEIVVEWSRSQTGDPESNWIRFEPGYHYMRSARFRIGITRPNTTADVRLLRFEAVAREFTP